MVTQKKADVKTDSYEEFLDRYGLKLEEFTDMEHKHIHKKEALVKSWTWKKLPPQPTPEAIFDSSATNNIVATPGQSVNAESVDLNALERAKELQAVGVDHETIRQQNGWHVGMDGKSIKLFKTHLFVWHMLKCDNDIRCIHQKVTWILNFLDIFSTACYNFFEKRERRIW